MKKTFSLQSPNKAVARVLDAVKHEVRKYVKRERNKALPPGFDQWEFDCRVGPDAANATPTALKTISAAIDSAAQGNSTAVFIEIKARPSARPPGRSSRQ